MRFVNLALPVALFTGAWGCTGSQAALQAEIDRLTQENQTLKQENTSLTVKLKEFSKPDLQNPKDEIESTIAPAESSGKVHLTIQSDGSIVVDGEAVTIESLPIRLTKVYQEDRQTQVVLHTESGVPYQRVVEVLDVVSAIGFDRLAMDTESEDEEKPAE